MHESRWTATAKEECDDKSTRRRDDREEKGGVLQTCLAWLTCPRPMGQAASSSSSANSSSVYGLPLWYTMLGLSTLGPLAPGLPPETCPPVRRGLIAFCTHGRKSNQRVLDTWRERADLSRHRSMRGRRKRRTVVSGQMV